MTYQEYFEKVQKEFSEKAETYFKMETELSKINGFGDLLDLTNYYTAKSEWQIASNNYYGFLGLIKNLNIKPEDEFISK